MTLAMTTISTETARRPPANTPESDDRPTLDADALMAITPIIPTRPKLPHLGQCVHLNMMPDIPNLVPQMGQSLPMDYEPPK